MKLKLIYLGTLVFLFGACSSEDTSTIIKISKKNIPVLIGKTHNEVLKITVIKTDSLPLTVKEINISTSNLNDVESIAVFYNDKNARFSSEKQFSKTTSPATMVSFKGVQLIKKDTSYFFVSYKLKENANLLNHINATCTLVSTNFGAIKIMTNDKIRKQKQRIGHALRKQKDDGVHTYRIPGLTTTTKGTLLAIYDVRRESGRDLQGHMDIGLNRSTDQGKTWEPMQIVMDMKNWGGLAEKFNGVSDANILVDKKNNTIYVAALWMHGVINSEGVWLKNLKEKDWNHQWRNKGSQPGLGVKETSQFLIVKSTDDGKTWSTPINLTKMCKNPKWWLWAPAPGHGITLKNGTLVFPTQGRDESGLPFSNITYSKDGGETWKTSSAASQNTTESMLVELSDGSIMLNMRDNRNRKEKGENNGRAIAVSSDLGETWQEHATSHKALIESVCMASLHRHQYVDGEGVKKTALFFSNPNSKYSRIKQTIKVSFDEGKTWPKKHWIELDEGRGAGYSCLTSIDNNTIGILYEGSQAHMTFQKIDISDIIKKIK